MLIIPPAMRYESVRVKKTVSSDIEAPLHQSFKKIIIFYDVPPLLHPTPVSCQGHTPSSL